MVDDLIKGVQQMLDANKVVSDIARANCISTHGAFRMLVTTMYLKGNLSLGDVDKFESFCFAIK